MASFSTHSKTQLATCDQRLQRIFNVVVLGWDCRIIQGRRGQEEQHRYFLEGLSEVDWPDSGHNPEPSEAVDVSPYPVNWLDIARFYYFAGYVKRVAEEMWIPIRYGGDWDGDTFTKDQTFNDLVHFELIL